MSGGNMLKLITRSSGVMLIIAALFMSVYASGDDTPTGTETITATVTETASATQSPTMVNAGELGTSGSYGVLSSTFTRNGGISAIAGDAGYTTLSGGGSHTVSGTNYMPAPPQAGLDQGAALAALNGQGCGYTFLTGTIDLASDSSHGDTGIYTPGIYCVIGTMNIGGVITLNGKGIYIFRSTGAFNTSDNSQVLLTGGAQACDVYWTPGEASTLGANTIFAGTIIDDSGITAGTMTVWTGRALAFGGTVTFDTDTIAVPSCGPAGTDTETSTITQTHTVTPTHTITPTHTEMDTITATPTSTGTCTFTPTFTVTILITDTPTDVDTDTATPTCTITESCTGTPSGTATPTDADTVTPSYTATASGTDTATPAETYTATITETAAETETVSATPTETDTAANTGTYTPTQTATDMDTFTNTPTTTATGDQTQTVTITSTELQTMTATPTFTVTQTITVTGGLGLSGTYGVLSSTFTRNGGISAITGDVGYTSLSGGGSHTASGTTYVPAPPQAGLDQAIALVALDNEACTYAFADGAIDLESDTTHGSTGVYTPGVYCVNGAMSIGGGGIITLNGKGTYIFRSTGAFTTSSNSIVLLTGGADACDVYWTPGQAATLGANTVFIGTVIDDAGITAGNMTSWTGRALAFGGTVTLDTDSITVPVCGNPAATNTPDNTATVTFTPADTISATNTFTDTITATGTQTATQTATGAATQTATVTETAFQTESTTATGTSTVTATFTKTFTAVSTDTPTGTVTVSASVTFTITATQTMTNTAVIATATPTFTQTQVVYIDTTYPNPINPHTGPLHVVFGLDSASNDVKMRIFTTSLRLVAEVSLGPSSAGKNNILIQGSVFYGLARGTYYYVIIAKSANGTESRKNIKQMEILY
jgi:type VI secretion system secreted protein VgrG